MFNSTQGPTRTQIFLAGAGVLGLLLLGGAIGRGCAPGADSSAEVAEQNEILRQQLETLRKSYDDVLVVNNDRVSSLQEVIDQQGDKMGELADIILKLRDQPAKVKYITNTVTVIQRETTTETVAVEDLPPEKLFGLRDERGEMVVLDRMTARDIDSDGKPDKVDFDSYNMTIEYDSVMSDDTSGFLVRIKSSYDDQFRTFPVKSSVTVVDDGESGEKKHKIVDVGLKMQIAAVAGATRAGAGPNVGYVAGLSMPWLRPVRQIEMLSPSLMLGSIYEVPGDVSRTVVRGGLTAASYNVGWHEKSIIKDTWVGIDAGISTDGSITAGLTLGTQL